MVSVWLIWDLLLPEPRVVKINGANMVNVFWSLRSIRSMVGGETGVIGVNAREHVEVEYQHSLEIVTTRCRLMAVYFVLARGGGILFVIRVLVRRAISPLERSNALCMITPHIKGSCTNGCRTLIKVSFLFLKLWIFVTVFKSYAITLLTNFVKKLFLMFVCLFYNQKFVRLPYPYPFSWRHARWKDLNCRLSFLLLLCWLVALGISLSIVDLETMAKYLVDHKECICNIHIHTTAVPLEQLY